MKSARLRIALAVPLISGCRHTETMAVIPAARLAAEICTAVQRYTDAVRNGDDEARTRLSIPGSPAETDPPPLSTFQDLDRLKLGGANTIHLGFTHWMAHYFAGERPGIIDRETGEPVTIGHEFGSVEHLDELGLIARVDN